MQVHRRPSAARLVAKKYARRHRKAMRNRRKHRLTLKQRQAVQRLKSQGFYKSIAKLRESLALPATAAASCGRHPGVVRFLVVEGAKAASVLGAATAREFAAAFLASDPAFAATDTGLAALQFEAWLAEKGEEIFDRFIEVEVSPEESDFYATFDQKITKEQMERLVNGVSGFAKMQLVVNAGDVSGDGVYRSNLVVMRGTPAREGLKKNDAGDKGPAAPRTREEYEKVARDRGLSQAGMKALYPGAVRESYTDPRGVVWTERDGRWVPGALAESGGEKNRFWRAWNAAPQKAHHELKPGDHIYVDRYEKDHGHTRGIYRVHHTTRTTLWAHPLGADKKPVAGAPHRLPATELVRKSYLNSEPTHRAVVKYRVIGPSLLRMSQMGEATVSTGVGGFAAGVLGVVTPGFLPRRKRKPRPPVEGFVSADVPALAGVGNGSHKVPVRPPFPWKSPKNFKAPRKGGVFERVEWLAEGSDDDDAIDNFDRGVSTPTASDDGGGTPSRAAATPPPPERSREDKALAYVESIRLPERKKYAGAWLAYMGGQTQERPLDDDFDLEPGESRDVRLSFARLGYVEQGVVESLEEAVAEGVEWSNPKYRAALHLPWQAWHKKFQVGVGYHDFIGRDMTVGDDRVSQRQSMYMHHELLRRGLAAGMKVSRKAIDSHDDEMEMLPYVKRQRALAHADLAANPRKHGPKRVADFYDRVHAGLKKTGYKVGESLEEGVYDPAVLKAVFIAGGSGSGKGVVARMMFGGSDAEQASIKPGDDGLSYISRTVGPYGFRTVNVDDMLTLLMTKAGVSTKTGTGSPAVQSPGGLRDQAYRLRDKQQAVWARMRLGLVIDGTGSDPAATLRLRRGLEALGYDTYMVFVDAPLAVALAGNASRSRRVPEEAAKASWEAAQRAKASYKAAFGANFIAVTRDRDYTADELQREVLPRLTRVAMRVVQRPLENPRGREWLVANAGTGDPRQVPALAALSSPTAVTHLVGEGLFEPFSSLGGIAASNLSPIGGEGLYPSVAAVVERPLPPNYRNTANHVEGQLGFTCGNCAHFGNGNCTLFDQAVCPGFTCDSFAAAAETVGESVASPFGSWAVLDGPRGARLVFADAVYQTDAKAARALSVVQGVSRGYGDAAAADLCVEQSLREFAADHGRQLEDGVADTVAPLREAGVLSAADSPLRAARDAMVERLCDAWKSAYPYVLVGEAVEEREVRRMRPAYAESVNARLAAEGLPAAWVPLHSVKNLLPADERRGGMNMAGMDARVGRSTAHQRAGRRPRRRLLKWFRTVREAAIDETSVSRVAAHLASGRGFMMVTGHRTNRTPQVNNRAHAMLGHLLRQHGYGFSHVKGSYVMGDGTRAFEPAYFVQNVSHPQALKLARIVHAKPYNQESVLWGRNVPVAGARKGPPAVGRNLKRRSGAWLISGDPHRPPSKAGDNVTLSSLKDYWTQVRGRKMTIESDGR